MKAVNSRILCVVVVLTLALTGRTAWTQDPTTEARNLLVFCLAHPEACSLSLDYEKGGVSYHINYNGTRLNPLASTTKIIHLLAYADGADDGLINRNQAIPLNEWGRFWIGHDGGELAAAYKRFSTPTPPLTVTNDQIASAMIRESDDAGPDYLVDRLGSDFFRATIFRYITGDGRGYIDQTQPIAAIFNSWTEGPPNPGNGIKVLLNSSGYESDEYRRSVANLFGEMHSPALMMAIRDNNGILFPWVVGPPPPAQPIPLSEVDYEQLTKGFFTRSNTRTMNRLMSNLLNRNLLSRRAQAIVEEFLEYRLKLVPPNPDLVNFIRYGIKDGDLGTFDGTTVRTRTGYGETKDGTKVVFTVQLTGTPGSTTDLGATDSAPGSIDFAVRNFLLAVATDPAFALEVQNRLGAVQDALAPSLIARIERNESTDDNVKLRVKVWNIGTAPTIRDLPLVLYFSADGTTKGNEVDHKRFGPLNAGESVEVELNSDTRRASKYFILDIDPNNVIPASQKQNNPQFELVPGH